MSVKLPRAEKVSGATTPNFTVFYRSAAVAIFSARSQPSLCSTNKVSKFRSVQSDDYIAHLQFAHSVTQNIPFFMNKALAKIKGEKRKIADVVTLEEEEVLDLTGNAKATQDAEQNEDTKDDAEEVTIIEVVQTSDEVVTVS